MLASAFLSSRMLAPLRPSNDHRREVLYQSTRCIEEQNGLDAHCARDARLGTEFRGRRDREPHAERHAVGMV